MSRWLWVLLLCACTSAPPVERAPEWDTITLPLATVAAMAEQNMALRAAIGESESNFEQLARRFNLLSVKLGCS